MQPDQQTPAQPVEQEVLHQRQQVMMNWYRKSSMRLTWPAKQNVLIRCCLTSAVSITHQHRIALTGQLEVVLMIAMTTNTHWYNVFSRERQIVFAANTKMSANGRLIIYKVFPINTSIVNVYVYDTLTRTTEQITGIDNRPLAPINLAISDNGRKIVYNKDGTRGQVNVLERLNDTVSVSVITTPEGESFDPAISPDGRYIAYTGTSNRNVYIVDLFGNTETLVSGGDIAVSDSVREGHNPQFTSDGTHFFLPLVSVWALVTV